MYLFLSSAFVYYDLAAVRDPQFGVLGGCELHFGHHCSHLAQNSTCIRIVTMVVERFDFAVLPDSAAKCRLRLVRAGAGESSRRGSGAGRCV